MKIKKSFLGIVLSLSMLINLMVPALTFATTLDYKTSVTKMKQLGIIDSTVTNVNKKMTNGELIKAMAIADGLGDSAASLRGKTIFPDVASGSVLSGYVNAIVGEGLLYGTNDGYFHPSSSATYQDICVNMVHLLGYSKSDLTGSFPINYIKKASDLELTDKLNLRTTDTISINAAAVMFDRLLSTQVKGTTKENFSQASNLYTDCIIQDDSDSYDNLADNEILTDKGIMTISASNKKKIKVGPTFRVKIEDGQITKVYGIVSSTVSITVNTIVGNVVNYEQSGFAKSMTLPSSNTYYYHGVKEAYTSISGLLKANSTITFDNNSNANDSYAVINDPIYSDPELASNINVNSDTLGNIVFGENTKIIKNGQAILKSDIKGTDVVYSVKDLNGSNNYILVVSNYVEGYITDIPADSNSLYDIQIDKVNYKYSDDMDITKLASFKEGDLVRLIRDKDDKVLDIKDIENKTGTLAEYVILGTSVTDDNLSNNEILTDKGTLQCLSGVAYPEVGAKYKLYVDGTVITKIDKKENTTENYAVTEKVGTDMKWENDKDLTSNMKLPKATVYYHNGEKVNYNVAVNSIKLYSSLMLSKNSTNNGYEYAVIIDPVFSIPKVYRNGDAAFLKEMDNSGYSFVYSNEMYTQNTNSVNYNDVVYFVSDIWNKNRYIYSSKDSAFGSITAFAPNKINASSITIDGKVYGFSKYFDKTKLDKYYTGGFIKVIIGQDGNIVDIY
ncbi:S-layer homology domain-containing protein [Clostridium estertheticum]|uniref:S-layer homology domain-containing protein n=1 Tax=Clostridium estertheticum TaxID=238834 RepID=UPI001CF33E8D|nr:S-layer homology domain-containing protein [Clostridium estertheticum]MCB2354997.1 S-layer homology domain-containing protein [Clostridium estertheticum]WAG41948.1 S-layer homology domain-containing protein [Clostridium estertheticum]